MTKQIKKLIHRKLEIVAQDQGVSVEEVRREIEEMIQESMNSPNDIIRLRWASIPREGEVPTAEEFMAHVVCRVVQ